MLAIAEKKDWLSGEHFSVDGTLIQAWAGQKSFVRKDDDQSNGDGGNFKGSQRSNDTHQSKTDPDSRLYRKGNNTGSELRYIGHTLSDNRHGPIASAMVTQADGHAERATAKAMINDARQALGDPQREVTLGADKGYDAAEFVQACQAINVTPHVVQNKSGGSLGNERNPAENSGKKDIKRRNLYSNPTLWNESGPSYDQAAWPARLKLPCRLIARSSGYRLCNYSAAARQA